MVDKKNSAEPVDNLRHHTDETGQVEAALSTTSSQSAEGVRSERTDQSTINPPKNQFSTLLNVGLGVVILLGLFAFSRYNYLLYHGLAEFFSIAVAWSVFLLVWNVRREIRNDSLLFLGIAYFFVGLLDLVHTLVFKGTGFVALDLAANYATQLWIAARSLEAVSLFLFPFLLNRRIQIWPVVFCLASVTGLFFATIFAWPLFPDCFVEGTGLTLFKKTAEYAICLTLTAAMVLLFQQRKKVETEVFHLMMGAMALAIVGEFAFTLYVSVYGLPNFVGHIFKICSFFLVYLALTRFSLVRPYTALYHQLEKENDQRIKREGVMTARLRLLHLADTSSLAELLQATLDEAERLTASRIGFFHFVNPDQETLALQAWSTNTVVNMCTAEGARRHYPINQSGVWVDCVKTRAPIIHQDYVSLPHRKGLPQGHPPIIRELVVPIIRGQAIVALLGVGNKPTDYNEQDLEAVTSLADLAWDLVERKRSMEETQQTLNRYELVLDGASGGIWDWDIPNKKVLFSSRWKALRGYTDEEIGDSETEWSDNVHPDDKQAVMAVLSAHCAGKAPAFEMEYRVRCKDGSWKWIQDRGKAIRDSNGKVIRMAGSEIDITERKLAEEALRQSEARFKALHIASFGGIAIHDHGIILECNQGLSVISGFSYEELIGMDGLLLISEKTREMVLQNILAGYEKSYEAVGLRKNNEEYPVRLEGRNIPYKGKNVRVVEFRDITEQKQKEEENSQLENQLRQSQKMQAVGQLAGGVAHDFNNMLGVIIGYSELVLEQLDPSQQFHSELEEIKKAARRSADLTRQLLTFARKQTIETQVLDLNQTIEGMLNMLRRLIGENIKINWMPGTGLWPINMDPSQIDQILANLCVNARDAIAGVGQLTVETENTTFDKEYCATHAGYLPGEYVRIAVSDTGSGMDKETLAHIFEPFFTTKGLGQGTGLGLATVYGAVKQNNGFINAYSEPGQGATFTIYIPRHVETTVETQITASTEPVLRGDEVVLLVEDEPTLLQMSKTMLERLGYNVLATTTPSEAIRLAGEYSGQIHLLATDVIMPELNGRELAARLQQSRPEMKCLFMSGYTADIIARHGVLKEGVLFIQKPFSKNELAAKVRKAFERN